MSKKILLIIMALAIMSFADCDAIAKKRVSSGKAKKTATTSKKKKSKKKNTQTESDVEEFIVLNQLIDDDYEYDDYVNNANDLDKVHVDILRETPSPQTGIEEHSPEPEKIYYEAEKEAQFPGGQAALMRFLRENLKYPERAQQNDIEGRVTVRFVINTDGSIEQVSIAKGVDKDIDQEALRIVKNMPNWVPASNNGVAVRSYFMLPIVFKLQR